jgi:hypothetical protein
MKVTDQAVLTLLTPVYEALKTIHLFIDTVVYDPV